MKIALPLTATAAFATHYGTATQFVVYDIDRRTRTVRRRLAVRPVENRPCYWPVLLRTAGADLLLAGGMGRSALARMAEHGLQVVTGVPAADPDALVAGWMAGTLRTGGNVCAGSHEGRHGPAHATGGGPGCEHDCGGGY